MSLIQFLRHAVRVRPGAFVVAVSAWAVFNTIILAAGLALQRFFDGIEAGAATWSAMSFLAIFVAVLVARFLSTMPAVFWQVTFEYGLAAHLRARVVQTLLRRPAARPSAMDPATIVNTLRDDVNALIAIPIRSVDTVTAGAFTVIALVLMARTNLLATVVAVIPLMIVFPLVTAWAGRVTRYRRRGRETTARMVTFLTGAFSATQVVQVNDATPRMLARLRQLNRERQDALVKDETVSAVIPAITIQISTVGAGLILLATAGLMRTGEFTVGDLALFDAYLFYCIQFAGGLGGFLTQWRQAGVSVTRLCDAAGVTAPELVSATETGTTAETSAAAEKGTAARTRDGRTCVGTVEPLRPLEVLEVRGLRCVHTGNSQGIHHVDLTIRPGTVTAVVGTVGSGKSTLLRAIMHTLPPAAGSVRWNGVPVTSDEQLHPPRCGFASQVPGVVSASIRDNVALGREVTDDDIRRALVRAQFDAEVAAMPAGLDTVVGPRGSKLSGGQLQRLALARMLVRECDLYVVDDTTSAIDVATERGLWRALLPGSPAAWLVASQRPEVLRYADQVIVLDAGRVVAAGTAEELARTNDFVQALSSSV